jgi:hypothetical protein
MKLRMDEVDGGMKLRMDEVEEDWSSWSGMKFMEWNDGDDG